MLHNNLIGCRRVLAVCVSWSTQFCFDNSKVFNIVFNHCLHQENIRSAMTESRSPRKRKNSDEAESAKKVTIAKFLLLSSYIFKARVSCCFLCKGPFIAFDTGCPLKNKLLNSQHTYLEVLSKLFQKESLASHLTSTEFSNSALCFKCKPLIEDLFRLQHQVSIKYLRLFSLLNICNIS